MWQEICIKYLSPKRRVKTIKFKNQKQQLKIQNKMVSYKCFKCKKEIDSEDLKKRFVCTQCGSKIFFKPRTKVKQIKTD